METTQSFWSTLPGILTAIAGIIAALSGLVATLIKGGVIGQKKAEKGESRPAETAATVKSKEAPLQTVSLRRQPREIAPGAVASILVRKNLFEARLNPTGAGTGHDFRLHPIGDRVVIVDEVTRLMWEREGAGPMTFAKAREHADRLCAERLAGYADWRLPTIEEALSLAEPEAHEDGFSLDPAFDRRANFIWTGDTAGEERAWIVRYHGAELVDERVQFNAMVRLVRTVTAATQ